MAWQGIYGHDEVVERFRRALARGRLASSFLFAGPPGVGKRTFAEKLAQALLCRSRPEEALDPCGTCASCLQALARTHPDLLLVAKPEDKSFLPLELLIGDKEHRMQEGLCREIGLKSYMGGRKVAVIDDADALNAEGANCLLKTLEEPPPRSVLILIGTSPAKQLPTIRSRCQLVRFQPLPASLVAELLLAQGTVADPTEARRLAQYSDGSLQRAVELSDPELWKFRETLLGGLAESRLDTARLSKAVQTFVDEAGKEGAARRGRLRQAVQFATEFYRGLARSLSGAGPPEERLLAELVVRVGKRCATGDPVAGALDRCLEAAAQIDRNAHPITLLECWLDDLAALAG